ncbi:hypothetical protein NA57DRAFT_50923 [Rhizodiscina lignyota]|uniref:Uncharacterized protein n=1 Tax=Rhizodiscina lignyota TaxID=1504668 RepID=A0A9P4IQ81_9PEZI|nr:hypothetical protein NA57DRAFT_50923 [Rhizodiscina lignyota]
MVRKELHLHYYSCLHYHSCLLRSTSQQTAFHLHLHPGAPPVSYSHEADRCCLRIFPGSSTAPVNLSRAVQSLRQNTISSAASPPPAAGNSAVNLCPSLSLPAVAIMRYNIGCPVTHYCCRAGGKLEQPKLSIPRQTADRSTRRCDGPPPGQRAPGMAEWACVMTAGGSDDGQEM